MNAGATYKKICLKHSKQENRNAPKSGCLSICKIDNNSSPNNIELYWKWMKSTIVKEGVKIRLSTIAVVF